MASTSPSSLVVMMESTGGEQTGIESVDGVVSTLASLDDLPVDEHVAVFERVHHTLGALLTGTPQD